MHHPFPSELVVNSVFGKKRMKNAEQYQRYISRLAGLLFVLLFVAPAAFAGQMTMDGGNERTFPVLQTKTGAYTNVTVTKQTKDWIFILHATGVCNIKATDLSPEARVALGYDAPPKSEEEVKAEAKAEAAAGESPAQALAQIKSHLNVADIKKFAASWRENRKETISKLTAITNGNPTGFLIGFGVIAALYLFMSTCFWLLCRKTHIAPGPLVWIPVLQIVPLLRAANMSRIWFFAFFIPVLNLVAHIVWCVKIVKARGKSPVMALLLMLPLTNVFVFLYLVFSSSAPVEMESTELLALETA